MDEEGCGHDLYEDKHNAEGTWRVYEMNSVCWVRMMCWHHETPTIVGSRQVKSVEHHEEGSC